jgi:hypothetical protein
LRNSASLPSVTASGEFAQRPPAARAPLLAHAMYPTSASRGGMSLSLLK